MLEVRGLVKVYPGPVAALQGVDLDIPLGMFGLLGPNGAGKTTFMRVLAGLLEPTSGSVTLDVVIPQYLVSGAEKVRAGSGWEVHARIKNVGTGRMPVEVATFRGERFPHGDGKHEPYRDARTAVTLGAGEERAITIRSDFEPQKLVVDPDVRVLQLERQKVTVELRAPAGANVLARAS